MRSLLPPTRPAATLSPERVATRVSSSARILSRTQTTDTATHSTWRTPTKTLFLNLLRLPKVKPLTPTADRAMPSAAKVTPSQPPVLLTHSKVKRPHKMTLLPRRSDPIARMKTPLALTPFLKVKAVVVVTPSARASPASTRAAVTPSATVSPHPSTPPCRTSTLSAATTTSAAAATTPSP